ncbi:MAG: class I SAM-dependent methyltransferase [Gaiellaceae bacterium]
MGAGSRPAPDFGPLAESYDRLRPTDANWWELFELLVAEGDLVGRRVLEVGCGTGALALALADRGARVWGIDPSEEMLARARARGGPALGLKRGEAEKLPFRDGWFERVVCRLVVHLVDRPRAFREMLRVLAPGGRAVVATFAPEHFEWYWLNDLFPSVLEIDRARFPTVDMLSRELGDAGFPNVRFLRFGQQGSLTREAALERIRGRYISTLRLLSDEEFAAGLTRAEDELPERIETRLEWVVLVAERSSV